MSTIFITGVSSGIGRGTAKVFLQHGWNVAGTELEPEEETELINYENFKVYKLNVVNKDDIAKVAEEVIKDFGTVDIVMNNAGIGLLGPIEMGDYDSILNLLKTNVLGYIMVVKAFLPHLRAKRSGTIVNVGACNGETIHPGLGYYCLSKAAIASLTEELLMELSPLGIDVKLVEPSGVNSNLGSVGTKVLEQAAFQDYDYFYTQQMPMTMEVVSGTVPGTTEHYDPIEPEEMGEIIYQAVTEENTPFRLYSNEHDRKVFELKEKMTFQEYIDFYKHYFKADQRL